MRVSFLPEGKDYFLWFISVNLLCVVCYNELLCDLLIFASNSLWFWLTSRWYVLVGVVNVPLSPIYFILAPNFLLLPRGGPNILYHYWAVSIPNLSNSCGLDPEPLSTDHSKSVCKTVARLFTIQVSILYLQVGLYTTCCVINPSSFTAIVLQ